MKVLMIHPHDLLTAPWTIRIIKLAESVARAGHDVTVAYFPSHDRRREGLIIRRDLPRGPVFVEMTSSKWNIALNIRKVCQLARNADVVHVQKCFSYAVIPALWAARLYGKPLHYDWDDNESLIATYWDASPFLKWEIALYERTLPSLATSMTVASAALSELALAAGFDPDCLFRAPVGADLEEFDALKGGPCSVYPVVAGIRQWVLYVGQLEGANYASILVRAFAEVAGCRPETGLLLVGGGCGQGALEEEIRRCGLAHRAFVTGYVPHASVPSIMARADVAVACLEDTPNARAKSPLKVVEYLAAGCAVIGSAVGEVIPMLETCGLLVPPGEVGPLRDAMLRLLDDPVERQELQSKARRRVEEVYNWDKSAKTLLRAYEKGAQRMRGAH